VKLHELLSETKVSDMTTDQHNILEDEVVKVGGVFLMPLIPNFEGLETLATPHLVSRWSTW
jgi:hypothetical protein